MEAQHERAGGALFPLYWAVVESSYGTRHAFRRLPLHLEQHFIVTSTGRKLLVVEADGTNGEDMLALNNTPGDLSLEDASLASRQIVRRALQGLNAAAPANAHLPPAFRLLRVYLGNSLLQVAVGGGVMVTLRFKVEQTQEQDLVLDSRA